MTTCLKTVVDTIRGHSDMMSSILGVLWTDHPLIIKSHILPPLPMSLSSLNHKNNFFPRPSCKAKQNGQGAFPGLLGTTKSWMVLLERSCAVQYDYK